MSVPLFLDSDYLDEKKDQVRFIYWKLDIKEIDLDDLCLCPQEPNSPNLSDYSFNKIKFHIFLNQLVIKGMKGNINYEFLDKNDFKELFDIVYNYNPPNSTLDYIVVDHHYVWVSLNDLPNQTIDASWYKRGAVFRIGEGEFSDLIYNKENMAFSSNSFSLEYSEGETNAYLDFLEDLNDSQ